MQKAAAKLGESFEENEEENGLESRHDMFTVVSVYVVFQVSLLGSLLSSSNSHFRSTCYTPHFFLSIAACLSMLITLVLAFIAEDMQEAAPPCYRKVRVGACFHVAAYPLLIYALISMH
ncbi:hypothetical protein SUGI_0173240 [Cryptomeria japonica]|nr:hypothetical protein SUGI_0173240 [Cryptomeria japonica]